MKGNFIGETRKLTVCGRYTASNSHVPELRLMGKWLKEEGFDIGSKVEVECKEGELIIRKIGGID